MVINYAQKYGLECDVVHKLGEAYDMLHHSQASPFAVPFPSSFAARPKEINICESFVMIFLLHNIYWLPKNLSVW